MTMGQSNLTRELPHHHQVGCGYLPAVQNIHLTPEFRVDLWLRSIVMKHGQSLSAVYELHLNKVLVRSMKHKVA